MFPLILQKGLHHPTTKETHSGPLHYSDLPSLLPFLSKTIELAASNQLSALYSQNNLLNPHQSGFRPGHSTETALLAVKESLQTAQAASLSSVLILLDLSAAFDTVNHSILLSSLAATGPRLDQVLPLWSLFPLLPGLIMYQHLVPLLLVSLRAQSSVPSSSLCTLGPLVLSSLRMACPTTAMLMIPNSFSPFPLPESLPA